MSASAPFDPGPKIDPATTVMPAPICAKHVRMMAQEVGRDGPWVTAFAMLQIACWYYTSEKDDGAIWKDVPTNDFLALNARLTEIGCLACHLGEVKALQVRAEVVGTLNNTATTRAPWLPPKVTR